MVATSITATGRIWIVDKIDNTTGAATMFIGWGTGGSGTLSTATTTDTGLQASATESFATTAVSQPATDTNQWVGTLTNQKAGGKTVEEAGVFTASTAAGGVMIIRATHSSTTLATGDAIQYTFSLQQVATA